MTGYTTQGWGELFLAEAGASAALAGLLFVAVSINLERIISIRSLPGAALATIVLLVAVLMVSTFALVPEQPRWVLGSEVLVVGIVAWSTVTGISLRALRAPIPNQPRFVPLISVVVTQGRHPADGGRRGVVAAGGWRRTLLARSWGGLLARGRGGQRLGVAGRGRPLTVVIPAHLAALDIGPTTGGQHAPRPPSAPDHPDQ
jgi:modulator of FtsH protease